jgi:hypothetical protein
VEGDCHFLEFCAFRKRGRGPALQSAEQCSSISPCRGAAVRSRPRLRRAPWGRLADRTQEWTCAAELPAPKSAWTAKSVRARFRKIAQQVLLYCFRGGNCGTFMPLSRVPIEFRIAVVWTRFVAAFSASSSVRFRILFTHAVLSRAVVCG